ncbi:hypothetical protein OIO90_002405 [Microbotryomycetes sp. JL221]|nr:hypothetical protein OIO90_002405 [Microbotryomycetes sp. JL221]
MSSSPSSSSRASSTWFAYLLITLWLPISFCHLFYTPMSWIAGGFREWYWEGLDGTKSVLVRLLIMVVGWTRKGQEPLMVKVTFDSSIDVSKIVKKDKDSGKLVLKLDRRAVYLSNHVSYADWIYTLFLFYLAELENAFYFFAPQNLQTIPLLGRTLVRFGFIFANKLDNDDKVKAGQRLWQLGRRSTKHQRSVGLVYYPEAAVHSAENQVTSRLTKQDKSDAVVLDKLLQPRSKALLFALRTLKLNTPDLALYDMTLAYSPAPAPSSGRSKPYLVEALSSLQNPPSTIHIHLRRFDLEGVPIGAIASSDNPDPKQRLNAVQLDNTLTEQDQQAFQHWLDDRWTEKNQLLKQFDRDEQFKSDDEGQQQEFKVEMRSFDDRLSIFGSYAAFYASVRIGRRLIRSGPGWTVALIGLVRRKFGV